MRAVSVRLGVLLMAVSVLSCSGLGRRSMDAGEVRIFYFPFYLETFHPISRGDIEQRARCRLSVPSGGRDAAALREIFSEVEAGEFDDRVVRLKVVGLGGGDVFVDKDRGLIDGDAKDARLREAAFTRLEKLIERIGTEQGCEVR